ncbi:MAG: aminopeptidase [Ignavibacteriales bacterium]|nr:aminopeptidase [Ignavibacteriales bacterium]
MNISNELYSASQIAIRDCMGTKQNEKILVITDEPLRTLGYSLWKAARDFGNDVLLTEILPRKSNGEEPPAEVAELMKKFDVVFCPTSKSLTHTDARRTASGLGVRIATLPGVTEEIMVRCMNADYNAIAKRTHALCAMMEKTSVIRVTSPAGTDVSMPIKGRTAHASSGLFREKGQSGNLPTGEAYLAPVEHQSHGIVVVDGSFATVGIVETPIRIVVKDGYATEISGGTEAEQLKKLLEPHGKDAYNIAEFGIGTNDRAIITGKIIEDEKVMGTIHIAFGDNKSMGGTVRVASHLDGLVRQPTVWFDEKMIMKNGKFSIEL